MSAASGVRRYADDQRGRVQRAMDEIAIRVLNDAKRIITTEGKVDTGELRASGSVAHVEDWLWRVAFTAKHAAFIHYGTRPHWAPLKPILDWVRRNASKLTDGSVGLKAPPGTPRGRPGEAELLRIAKAIQAKIAREGTDPVPFLAIAVDNIRPQAPAILAKHIRGDS